MNEAMGSILSTAKNDLKSFKNFNFYSFKLPTLWYYITKALGKLIQYIEFKGDLSGIQEMSNRQQCESKTKGNNQC
jgi:hypothetical protein